MRKYLHAITVRQLCTALFYFLLLPGAIAAPTVHFGPAPQWIVPVTMNERQPDLRNVSDGYYLKLYEEVDNVALQASYTHVVREIFSEAGVQDASDISISFNPAYEQLTVHQVRVWRDGQPMDRLRKDAFKVLASEQDLSRHIYNGTYSAYLIMDDIRKGDRIEYAYTITGENPVFEGKFFTSFTFQGGEPIGQVHYRLIAPTARPLNFKYFNDAAKPTVTTESSNTVYDWDLRDVKGLENARVYSPSWFYPYAFVQVSEYKNWGEVTNWAFKINTPDSTLKGALRERVDKLASEYADNRSGLLRAIVNLAQNEVRYMGVEIGRYSHKANSPSKVYEQRYGDCKDKALLIVSMLRYVGIDADMALVNASFRSKVMDRLPTPSAFNHAIAVAHLPGRDVWIDGTMTNQGGQGLEIYCPDYGCALVLKPGANALTKIPAPDGGKVVYREEYDVQDVKSPVTLTIYTDYYGNSADNIREQLAGRSKANLEKSYLDYYAKKYPHIEALDTLSVTEDKETNIVKTVERYKITDFFEYDSATKYYSVSFYASMIRNTLPDITKKRDFPVAISYPYDIDFTVNVTMPMGWNIEKKHEYINRNSYTFTGDVSATGKTLSLRYLFATLKDHIAPEDLQQYERDHKKLVNELLYYSVSYREGGGTLESGVNYLMVLVFIVLLGGFIYGAVYLYKMPTADYYVSYDEPGKIGGWLILPIIGLGITAIRSMYFIFSTGLLNKAIWHVYDSYENAAAIRGLLFMEFTVNIAQAVYAVFCLVLIFKKRDILPRHAIIFYVGTMGIVILDTVISNVLIPGDEMDMKNIYRSVFAACIWGAYFANSQRVREIFVVPYVKEGTAPMMYAEEHVPAVQEEIATEDIIGAEEARTNEPEAPAEGKEDGDVASE